MWTEFPLTAARRGTMAGEQALAPALVRHARELIAWVEAQDELATSQFMGLHGQELHDYFASEVYLEVCKECAEAQRAAHKATVCQVNMPRLHRDGLEAFYTGHAAN